MGIKDKMTEEERKKFIDGMVGAIGDYIGFELKRAFNMEKRKITWVPKIYKGTPKRNAGELNALVDFSTPTGACTTRATAPKEDDFFSLFNGSPRSPNAPEGKPVKDMFSNLWGPSPTTTTCMSKGTPTNTS